MGITVPINIPTDGAVTMSGTGFEVTAYLSPEDGQPVVEIDTTPGLGEVRVYLNDGPIYADDPEEPTDETTKETR